MSALRAAVFAASLLASASASRAQDGGAPRRFLTVRVYNYAEVNDRILERSKRVSERVFDEAGLEVAWLDCPTSAVDIPANRSCAARPPADHAVMNLLPRAMSRAYRFERVVFGFALPTKKGSPGNHVSLFFQRVLDLAYHGGIGASFEHGQAIVLGHMVAHEIGHLLLGPDSHARSGVMSFPWNKRTLARMERGLLRFSEGEVERMKAELERRMRMQEPPP